MVDRFKPQEFSFYPSTDSESSFHEISNALQLLEDIPSSQPLSNIDTSGYENSEHYVVSSQELPSYQSNDVFPPTIFQPASGESSPSKGDHTPSVFEANETLESSETPWPGRTTQVIDSREYLFRSLKRPDSFVESRPFMIPSKCGVYTYFIKAASVEDSDDLLRDSLSPWNGTIDGKSVHLHTRYYKVDTPYSRYAKKSDTVGSYVNSTEGRHPIHPISKKIFSLRANSESKDPPPDTFYGVVYTVTKDFTYKPNVPRLCPSTSKALREILTHSTPKKAFHEHVQVNGGIFNVTPEKHITLGGVRSLAKRTPNRSSGLTKKILPDDASVITELIKNCHPFLPERSITKDDDRILIASKSMLEFAKSAMLPLSLVKRINEAVDKLCNNPFDVSALSNFVATKEYRKWKRCGVVYIDTTFDMGVYYVTVAYVSVNNFIVKKTQQPTFTVAGIMLSKRKNREAYSWFGSTLSKLMSPSTQMTFRAVCNDQDYALDAFSENDLFKNFVKVHCGEHFARNFEHLANNDKSVKRVLFGQSDGLQNHVVGIFDRTEFEDFSTRLSKYAESLRNDHPNLSARLGDSKMHHAWFERLGMKTRLKAGFGLDFATTNSVEGWNQCAKFELKGKRSIQDLVPDLIKHLERSFTVFASAVYSSNSADTITLRPELLKPKEGSWIVMTRMEKINTLKRFGLTHLDELPCFAKDYFDIDIPIPPQFGLSLETKVLYSTTAKTMEVQEIGGKYAVVSSNSSAFVTFHDGRYVCPCVKAALICPHILAVNLKFPEAKVIDAQIEYLETESEANFAKRTFRKADGSKPGSRRHGTTPSRNNPVYPQRLLSIEGGSSSLDNDITTASPSDFNEGYGFGQKRPCSNFDNVNDNNTSLKKQRLDVPSDTSRPLHFNDNAFVVILSKTIPDANRKCAHEPCRKLLAIKKFVFSHYEQWISNGKVEGNFRYVCSVECLTARYPYVTSNYIQFGRDTDSFRHEVEEQISVFI